MKNLIVLVVLLIATASPVFAQTNSKEDRELTELIEQLTDAQGSFDVATLDRIFTSDYIEISPAGEFDPRDKVLGFYKPEMKPPANALPKVELSEHSIRRNGNHAIVIVKITYTMGTAPPRSMRATFVCRKEKSSWKIASSQYTGIRPPQPPKT